MCVAAQPVNSRARFPSSRAPPAHQLFLTDNDLWRATSLLQLDETIAIYRARLLEQPHNLVLLNNKHPLMPESTLHAGHRLVLRAWPPRSSTSCYWCAKRGQRAEPALTAC